jgi:hypothetical protein
MGGFTMSEIQKALKKRWYDVREIGSKEYPVYHLTHYNGSKQYTVMILRWDTEKNEAAGWFAMAAFDTIRECREYMKHF